MHGIVFQQVHCRLDRACGVELDHFNVVTARACDMRKGAAADAAKTVDADFDCHDRLLLGWVRSAIPPRCTQGPEALAPQIRMLALKFSG